MKHKVMNIRPQEVTENGERTVRYKGSDVQGQRRQVPQHRRWLARLAARLYTD